MSCATLTAVVVAALFMAASATDGGDISEFYDSSVLQCCKSNGWEFIVVRSYHSYGAPDPNGPKSLAAAEAAGIPHRDVYHFPCTSQSATTQIQDDVNHVGKSNFGMLWFDIETNVSPGCGWSSNLADNCNFMEQLIAAGAAEGLHMGIYASTYMWEIIMGTCTAGADHGLGLWYAHYDGTRSFSDFSPFGGWTAPNVKQYNDAVGFCGINADADWYPS